MAVKNTGVKAPVGVTVQGDESRVVMDVLRAKDRLLLPERAGDPAAMADAGLMYAKDAAGVTQLFYRASDGTVHQVTPPPAAGGDFDVLKSSPGGVLIGNSTGEFTVWDTPFTLLAGELGTVGKLVIEFHYFLTQLSGASRTLFRRFKVGGVEAADLGFADSIFSGVQKRYFCRYEIIPQASQTLNHCTSVDWIENIPRSSTTPGAGIDEDTNFDFTVNKTIDVTFQWDALPGVGVSVKLLGPVKAYLMKA